MKRLIAIIAAAAAVAAPAVAMAATGGVVTNGGVEAPACDPGRALRLARSAYEPERWRGEPAHARVREARAVGYCRAGRAAVARQRRQFYDYRRYRRAAPYAGPQCAGPKRPGDRCWWAIPWPIVCGESGGEFHIGGGAYGLLDSTWRLYGGPRRFGTGQPHLAGPLAQHVVAAEVWADHGLWTGLC